MRLLLDEMLSASVAEQLRARHHDVEAVFERGELRGLPDDDVFEYAQAAACCLVTYNRDDFLELDCHYRSRGRAHHGIVVLNPRRFPQGRGSLRSLVSSLDRLVAAGAPYESFIHWLE